MSIKVSIYEDNAALRDSLASLIANTEGLTLCAAYPDCLSVLDNCTANLPDVILMDIDMPGMTGTEATALVKEAYPLVNIMILTIFEDKEKVFAALRAGASGYLLKKSSTTDIVNAVVQLHSGGSPMTGEIARKVLDFFSAKPSTVSYNLSAREADILRCLVNGDSYKMVADHCCISLGTVFSHINSIYRKLQVNSKSEAVVKAMNERLV